MSDCEPFFLAVFQLAVHVPRKPRICWDLHMSYVRYWHFYYKCHSTCMFMIWLPWLEGTMVALQTVETAVRDNVFIIFWRDFWSFSSCVCCNKRGYLYWDVWTILSCVYGNKTRYFFMRWGIFIRCMSGNISRFFFYMTLDHFPAAFEATKLDKSARHLVNFQPFFLASKPDFLYMR